ncbi:MAG TPA: hypothetical protein VM049_07890 [Gaiellaceae bacterium]|nr:hypothetical protein [Gaiellaceae bacterium]
MLRLLALALVPLALVSGAAAGGGGPSPGLMTGWDGTLDATRGVRYVVMPVARSTIVAAVRTSDGRMLRYSTIKGGFGVPIVAYDGTTEGVSRDGRTLVLAGFGAGDRTRFVVLSTARLQLRKTVTLPGLWSFDALSRDARTLFAVQYHGSGPNAPYSVRAVSLVTGKPVGGAIVAKGEEDEAAMNGSPWSRARSANGAWAYTFYAKPNGTAFVHALNTSNRRAVCIDLPWQSSTETLSLVRLSLADAGRSLVLARPGGNRLAVVDTTSFNVRSLATP